jgi:two-component system, NtrC family, nitrogen regulation sensor histidine kinase NtrY
MPRRARISHLRKVQALAFACGVPGLLACILLLLGGEFTSKVWITVLVLGCGGWFFFAMRLQAAIVRPLQTASNMLSGMREGDFTLQASYVDASDPLGQVMLEINLLREVLSEHRLGAIEANALLDKVLDEVDAAILAFDGDGRITLANEAAARLVGRTSGDALVGLTADSVGLAALLAKDCCETIPHPLPHRPGRFLVRQGIFRDGGRPHALFILIDVSRNLREEELQAWKRLIRVLGHELNNSLAPIKSIANSLSRLLCNRTTLDAEDRQDVVESLEVIETRAESLSRFMRDYARLAKLPQPSLRATELRPLVQRVANLSEHIAVAVDPNAPDLIVQADPDQLEQVLINLTKNAVEAVLEESPLQPPARARTQPGFEAAPVRVTWRVERGQLRLFIEDEGPGLANLENLFTPFFSTKSSGSGIGLTLCRQIIEAHRGTLHLRNREDVAHGCRAEIVLPGSSTPTAPHHPAEDLPDTLVEID